VGGKVEISQHLLGKSNVQIGNEGRVKRRKTTRKGFKKIKEEGMEMG